MTAIEIIEALLLEAQAVHQQMIDDYGLYSNETRMAWATREAYEEALRKLKEEL